MRPAHHLALLPIVLASACIQHRLDVDIRTDVGADGACTRRIEYRLRRGGDQNEGRASAAPGYGKAPGQDPLRAFFRFPSGDAWTVRDDVQGDDLHVVTAEAVLSSPNDIDWDYWRQAAPAARPARNYVSFALTTSGADTVYEYAETFRDPASPIAAVRRFAELAQGRDGAFADALARALKDDRLPRGPLRRSYRDVFAQPFARRVAALSGRPTFGPHERQELERLIDEGPFADFKAALPSLLPGRDSETVDHAMDAAFEEIGAPLAKEMAAAGLPLELASGSDPANLAIHFRVTLVMPAAITRANTCFSGDTATWEFDQDDLYAGAVPLWAKASTR